MDLKIIFLGLGLVASAVLWVAGHKPLSEREKIALALFTVLYGELAYAYWRLAGLLPADINRLIYALFAAGILVCLTDLVTGRYHRLSVRNRNLKLLRKKQGPLYELVLACQNLSSHKLGALIVLERKTQLRTWIHQGIGVEAGIGKELLFSIFTPPGDLHDGAVIIREGRIASARVILPFARSDFDRKDLGTRHRAGVGISETTDAISLIVSEETGAVSLADGGHLHYDIPLDKLANCLYDSLRFRLKKTQKPAKKPEKKSAKRPVPALSPYAPPF